APSRENSMMSPISMQSGARARDSRKRCGLSGCRALTCPKESTTPSRARMRLAVTISSSSSSSLVIGVPLFDSCSPHGAQRNAGAEFPDCASLHPGYEARSQDEAYGAQRAELMGIDQHAALLDPEAVAGAAQHVAVGADVFADALIAAEAVADEIGRDADQIALDGEDAHIGEHAAGAGFRIFRVAVGILHPDDALADALAVVGDQEQRAAVIALRLVVGRHVVACGVRQPVLPGGEPPFVEQRRLMVEKVLHLRAGDQSLGGNRRGHACAPMS